MTTNNESAVMTEEELREGLVNYLYSNGHLGSRDILEEIARVSITYLRAHSPEAAEIARLKAEIDSETKLHLTHEAEHAALIIGLKDINERLTRENERLKAHIECHGHAYYCPVVRCPKCNLTELESTHREGHRYYHEFSCGACTCGYSSVMESPTLAYPT